MLLLASLLLPMVLGTDLELTVSTDNAVGDTLQNIELTCPKSSKKCSDAMNYKTYKSLNICNAKLEHVDAHAFDKFNKLLNLSLANNSFTTLPEFVFSKLLNLRYLNLSHNDISSFYKTFEGLKKLNYLDVSNNKLESLDKGYFFGIPRKTYIIVKGNDLRLISTGTFQSFRVLQKDIVKKSDEPVIKDSVSKMSSESSPRDIFIEVCYEERKLGEITVTRVKVSKSPMPSKGCKKAVVHNNELLLTNMDISKFRDDWYQIDDSRLVTEISFSSNKIRRVTGALLKNLPETVTLDLSSNKFESNNIRSIENMNSLATNISVLRLRNSGLVSTVLVANLPSSLTELDLESNGISKIVAGTFSKFKRLSKLNFYNNKLTKVRTKDLQGLSSLVYLDLSLNNLYSILPDAFSPLQNLKELNLAFNKLIILPKGIFSGLGNIQTIDLGRNYLKNIDGIFVNAPDTLLTLGLQYNEIKALRVNSFVKVPKRTLSLYGNKISRIEKGAFDLPTLEDLNLNWNKLKDPSGNSFKGLSRLKHLSLGGNDIYRIKWNFWEYLKTVETLDISENPIKSLKYGDLSGMSKKREGFVLVKNTPIEIIQPGVFTPRVPSWKRNNV